MRKSKNNLAGIILLLISIVQFTFGQDKRDSLTTPYNCCNYESFEGQEVFTIAEEMPEFVGGDDSLRKYLSVNLIFPEGQTEIQSKVYVSFIIDTLGQPINICIVRPFYPDKLTELEKTFLKIIVAMPRWLPGKQRGKKVPVKYLIPVNIGFQHND
jgi:hypothetical protein